MTLNNDKQKVNDEEGNPIEISVVVIWRICDTSKAVFAVENYMTFISTQCDSAIRQPRAATKSPCAVPRRRLPKCLKPSFSRA